MTLILAIPAQDGIVMASDGQITSGMVRSPGKKIQKLNDRCIWAASGEIALIQRIEERMETLQPTESLSNLRDQIAQIVKQCVTELLNLDFRTPFFQNTPETLLRLHPGDFIFVECAPSPCILHITINSTPEWIKDRPFASGNGDLFAYALLQKYQGNDLDIDRASTLAYKVIEEAIAVGAYGLGPPIEIWHLKQDKVHCLDEAEITQIEDAVKTLRQYEVELLVKKNL